MHKIRNVTRDSTDHSVYVSVCQMVGFSILFFPWKIVKYVTFLRAVISFPVSVNCQIHTKTLLSIYRVCGTIYECFYNNTLNISHNSHCINDVLNEMYLLVYCTSVIRYDNVTLSPLVLQWGLRFGPIQRNGAARGVIHTGRFFVLIPLKWLEKLTEVKDKYI